MVNHIFKNHLFFSSKIFIQLCYVRTGEYYPGLVGSLNFRTGRGNLRLLCIIEASRHTFKCKWNKTTQLSESLDLCILVKLHVAAWFPLCASGSWYLKTSCLLIVGQHCIAVQGVYSANKYLEG